MVAAAVVMLIFAACSSGAAPRPAAGAPQDVPAPATAAPSAAPAGLSQGDAGPGGAVPGALIVRTGTLDLEVPDVDAAVATGRDLVISLGGYVAASEEADKGGDKVASIT